MTNERCTHYLSEKLAAFMSVLNLKAIKNWIYILLLSFYLVSQPTRGGGQNEGNHYLTH